MILKLSNLRQKGRVEFFCKQIKQVDKFIESHDFELICYHYGISSNSLKNLVSIMKNLPKLQGIFNLTYKEYKLGILIMTHLKNQIQPLGSE
jgi:hypothetical protein